MPGTPAMPGCLQANVALVSLSLRLLDTAFGMLWHVGRCQRHADAVVPAVSAGTVGPVAPAGPDAFGLLRLVRLLRLLGPLGLMRLLDLRH